MADVTPTTRVVARSPIEPDEPLVVLDGWEVSGRRSDAELTIIDETPRAKVLVRGPSDGRLAARIGAPFGRAAHGEDGVLVVGSGPGEWLLLGAAGHARSLMERVGEWSRAERAERNGAAGNDDERDGVTEVTSVVDVTHGRALVRLTGDQAVDLLTKVCAVDPSDDVTPNGAAFRSSVAKVVTDVIRDDRDGTRSYLLHCERSSGQYLFDALLDAGSEFGIDVDGFIPHRPGGP